MGKIITIGISLLLIFSEARAQKIDYDNSSKWFLGFNLGGTWHSSDVRNQVNGGWGVTLGKSFNYNYGRALSFDLRARYLRGKWYGQDFDTTSLSSYNPDNIQDATAYPLQAYKDSLGFGINNFQTDVHRLGLELVLHANGVRERSGWDPYIFGGIGFTWHQTYGNLNQADSTGGIYDYASLDSYNSATVPSILDGTYDTPLVGSSDKYSVSVMPSLGLGIGYQVGKRTTIGLEHKTTFTLADNFDGFESTAARSKNDLYHYTSFYVQFRFRTNRNNGSTGGNNVNNIDNYNQNNLTNCNTPVIIFRSPTLDAQMVTGHMFTVTADVSNVTLRENITFIVNGVSTTNFTFDAATGRLASNVALQAGSNTFEIKTFNSCGNAESKITVSYQNCTSPAAVWVNPSVSGNVVFTPNTNLSAQISNITGRENILFKQNGVGITSFVFNQLTGVFESNVNLIPGANTFEITTTNPCGVDIKTTTVTYQNCLSPVISFVDPSTPNIERIAAAFNLKALVENVTGFNQIQLKVNGIVQTPGLYSANTKLFTKAITLVEGGNTIEITATNNCGSVTELTTIIYKRPSAPVVIKPLITLTNPTSCPATVYPGNVIILGTVTGVTSTSQVSITMNGQPVNNYTSTFNAAGMNFQITLNALQNVGTYNLSIVAVNGGGSANVSCTIQVILPAVEEQKITICHYPPGNNGNPQTIEIPLSAWPAHQAHGDKLGPCPEATPVPEEKITICHYPPGNNRNPQTIEIPLSAWPAHQAHGDKLGPCPEATPVPEEKITICHYPPGNNGNPQTIEIPLSAWPAHQAHGDKLGPCVEETPAPTPEEKITICHYPPGNNGNPQTIEIPLSAWPAHQAHGDKLGPCVEETPAPAPTPVPEEKITICHYPPGNNGNPQTIEIPLSAWPAHQAHGDKLGPCVEETPSGNGDQGGNGQGNSSNGGNTTVEGESNANGLGGAGNVQENNSNGGETEQPDPNPEGDNGNNGNNGGGSKGGGSNGGEKNGSPKKPAIQKPPKDEIEKPDREKKPDVEEDQKESEQKSIPPKKRGGQ